MPEFIQHDINGRIIQKWYSVDPAVVSSLPNILEIARDVFTALTKYHLVENGAVRQMTQAEMDALTAEETQAQIDAENVRLANMDDKISGTKIADFSMAKVDGVIDAIANLSDAKQFLKRLCRYIAKG